jgi:hypothetical protein
MVGRISTRRDLRLLAVSVHAQKERRLMIETPLFGHSMG